MRSTCAALVHPIRGAGLIELEKRHSERMACAVAATSRPLDLGDGMAWGGMVRDISAGGLRLSLCFPFRPGTFLAVDMQSPTGAPGRSLLCQVVHVHDEADGTWTLGCSFLKPLPGGEAALLV